VLKSEYPCADRVAVLSPASKYAPKLVARQGCNKHTELITVPHLDETAYTTSNRSSCGPGLDHEEPTVVWFSYAWLTRSIRTYMSLSTSITKYTSFSDKCRYQMYWTRDMRGFSIYRHGFESIDGSITGSHGRSICTTQRMSSS